jgi:hypothetical protein
MTMVWMWRGMRVAVRAVLTVAVGAAVALPVPAAGQTASAEPEVTFTKDIAPILQRSCQNCHRPNSLAPMSLLTYEDARPWARAIKARTARVGKSDVMPPWYIEKDIGIQEYKGDISLSAEEIATMAAWADNGAPRGNPADMPPPLAFADAALWEIGEPDLIVSSPSIEVAETSPDWWGPIGSSPTGLTEDRYVMAVEMKEVNDKDLSASRDTVGSRWSIHHMIWNAVDPNQPSAAEMAQLRKDDPDEFRRVVAERSVGQGFWPVHEVGRNADYFDPKAGLRLKAGSNLVFSSAHVHSTGAQTTTRLDIGFKFHPKGYTPEFRNIPQFTGTLNIDVRGNEANQRVESFQTLPRNVKLTGFEPHLHAAGVRMCLDAIYVTGLVETLSCSGYNHSWVRAYPYADHVAPLLPKGTILRVTGYFDTTPANKNVADGRNWSGLGHRSIDQMMINLSQGVYLTDEQFAQEMAQRSKDLNLTPGQYVLGCPLCGPDEVEASSQNQQ